MKANSSYAICFLFLWTLFFPANAWAQLFGADDEDLAKIEFELKKFNTHLENLKTEQIKSLQRQQEDLLRQIEEIKQVLPQLQASIDQNKQETIGVIGKTHNKLKDLEGQVRDQVLQKMQQQNKILDQFRQAQENLKEGLAQDMEDFEKSSKSNFQNLSTSNQATLRKVVQQLEAQSSTTEKGFEDTIALFREDVIPTIVTENQKNREAAQGQLKQANLETQKTLEAFSTKNKTLNQKLIEILQKSLKQGMEAKNLLDVIDKDLHSTHTSLDGTNENLKIADGKISKLAEGLKAMQTQQTATHESIASLKTDLDRAGEFDKLMDEKFNKLIDLSTEIAVHSTELESSVVGQFKQAAQTESANAGKVDLANEKLSRLIEILKTIAKEQANIDPLASMLGAVQKDQAAMKKVQTILMTEQKEIRDALADLRRKANVNISRNDDIKKALGKLNPTKNK
ncbi:MAG: hypothetical protein HOL15_07350 [Nitrospinaceae bacterium]|nr:hypothetical protein [Nitrospinaceae bacterium]MBT5867993.1 hypothetical protein [Nitrospinaceae bacterium]